jgi:hypothetical protein
MPGRAFVHFSAIQTDPEAYRKLRPRQRVDAVIEGPLAFEQDGYRPRKDFCPNFCPPEAI